MTTYKLQVVSACGHMWKRMTIIPFKLSGTQLQKIKNIYKNRVQILDKDCTLIVYDQPLIITIEPYNVIIVIKFVFCMYRV